MTAAVEIEVNESEQELVSKAQTAVSRCNWVVGECAFKWTQKHARGRTDADFAALVGLSPDQVYQRRRVFETFGDVYEEYPSLKWSHFYAALNWDDAPECLGWAEENEATVAEMKAWRRALHGEDLDEPAADEWAGDVVAFVPEEVHVVRDPGAAEPAESAAAARGPSSRQSSASAEPGALAGVARSGEAGGDKYAPYREGAGSPAPRGEPAAKSAGEKPSAPPERVVKRLTARLEEMADALTPEVVAAFPALPKKSRDRFLKAVARFTSAAARLM